ncbi:hypothetical protein ACWEV4_16070 [Streptomyces sp. NPDC003860]
MTQQAQWTRVTTAGESMDAVRSEVPAIDVSGVLRGMPMLTLPPACGCAAALSSSATSTTSTCAPR